MPGLCDSGAWLDQSASEYSAVVGMAGAVASAAGRVITIRVPRCAGSSIRIDPPFSSTTWRLTNNPRLMPVIDR